MTQVTMQANELLHTDVKRVSLVKRAATRMPWKIIKQEDENTMLDLAKLFKKDPVAPSATVFAAIVRKGVNLDEAKALLKSAGLSIDSITDSDTAHVFMQKTGEPSEDAVLVKSNDDVGFVVENLAPAMSGYDFQAATFTSVFKTENWMPSPAMASRMLAESLNSLLKKSDDGYAEHVAKAGEDYGRYAKALTMALPETVAKLDRVLKTPVHPSRTDIGSENPKDAYPPLVVDAALGGGTTPAATADDKKAVYDSEQAKRVNGGKLNLIAKGMGGACATDEEEMKKAQAIVVAARKAETDKFKGWAEAAVAKGDFASAAKFVELAKAGGFMANTMDTGDGDSAAAQRLKEKQSGAGGGSTTGGANVQKKDMISKADVDAVIEVLTKSAEAYERVGLTKRALGLRADIAKLTKDGCAADEPSPATSKDGSSPAASDDDNSNTAVNATKKKPDPNTAAPAGMDSNGWTSKVAGEVIAELNKGFGAAMSDMRNQIAALVTKVDAVSERARKTEEAVTGTVHADPGSDRTGHRAFFQKDETPRGGSNVIPLLDTALHKLDDEDPSPAEIRKYARNHARRRWG